jgi:hypothetical protein
MFAPVALADHDWLDLDKIRSIGLRGQGKSGGNLSKRINQLKLEWPQIPTLGFGRLNVMTCFGPQAVGDERPLFGSSFALNYHSMYGPVDMARQIDGRDA